MALVGLAQVYDYKVAIGANVYAGTIAVNYPNRIWHVARGGGLGFEANIGSFVSWYQLEQMMKTDSDTAHVVGMLIAPWVDFRPSPHAGQKFLSLPLSTWDITVG